MTKEAFQQLWEAQYPEASSTLYSFRDCYPDRWFRIHSLPESQRYAYTEDEWNILLTRQNEIITDLFGLGTAVILVTGDFDFAESPTPRSIDENKVLKEYSFVSLDDIDLFSLHHERYDQGAVYRSAFAETVWSQNLHDDLLRQIADDQIGAYFVSFENNIIVAPYDGGVDFVLRDQLTRDHFKHKYWAWLSKREDGL